MKCLCNRSMRKSLFFNHFSFAEYVVKCQMWLCSIVTYTLNFWFKTKKSTSPYLSLINCLYICA